MQITLYRTMEDHRTIHRNKTSVCSATVITKGPVDRSAPVVYLAASDIGTSHMDDINYAYINDFNRYYFVKTKALPGGQVEISGKVDVLALPGIDHVTGIVIKSGNYFDEYVNDGDYVAKSIETKEVYQFADLFLDKPITMLIAMGGQKEAAPENDQDNGTGGDGGTRPVHEGFIFE